MQVTEATIDGIRYLRHARKPNDAADLRPVLIMVHGSGGRCDVFRPLLELMSTVTSLAVDVPGHGGTPGPSLKSVEEWAAFIERFRELMGFRRIIVFGHSLGGAAAQLFAREHPDRCVAAIIASSGARFTADPSRTERVRNDWSSVIDEFVDGQVSPEANGAARQQARLMVEQRDPQVLADDLAVCRTFRSADWLPTLHTPCLVLVAMEDPMTPYDRSLELYDLIPNAELSVVSPGGHSPFIEHPLRYASSIESYIIAHAGAASERSACAG